MTTIEKTGWIPRQEHAEQYSRLTGRASWVLVGPRRQAAQARTRGQRRFVGGRKHDWQFVILRIMLDVARSCFEILTLIGGEGPGQSPQVVL